MALDVIELVSSVQGEGKYTGYATTFVRLHRCNLNCSFCDTKYANTKKNKRKFSVETLLSNIFKMGNKYICITGGEPLLQEDVYPLIYDLVDRGFIVSIETNGSIPIEDTSYKRSYSYCMDIKCPSSKMDSYNCYTNLGVLKAYDEVKFVVSDQNDYAFAKDVLRTYPTKAQIIFSPMFKDGQHNGRELAHWLIEDKIANARVGVQLHKLINVY